MSTSSSSRASTMALANFLAGALGGTVSLGLTYPMFTLVTKLQVRHRYGSATEALMHVLRAEGVPGLYSGVGTSMVGNAYQSGVYYGWYSWFRRLALRRMLPGARADFVVALAAGTMACVFSLPVWVCVTRLQTDRETRDPDDADDEDDTAVHRDLEAQRSSKARRRPSLSSVVAEILREDGVTGFWRGLRPALILVTNPAIQYAVFERLLTMMRDRQAPGVALSQWHFVVLGAVSKAVATVATYPLITVKTRLQARQTQSEHYEGTLAVLRRVYQEGGFLGFYSGMSTKLVQSVLNASFLFWAHKAFSTGILRLLLGPKD